MITRWIDVGSVSAQIPEAVDGTAVARIDSMAFAFLRNKSLASVRIPVSVTVIPPGTFACCGSLRRIEVAKENPAFSSANGVLYSRDGKFLLAYPPGNREKSFSVPEGVEAICEDAFGGCHYLDEIKIPESVRLISRHAFVNCRRLNRVHIHSGFICIDNDAFKTRTALTFQTCRESFAAQYAQERGIMLELV